MDDHRPAMTADSCPPSFHAASAATTGDVLIEPAPPFRSTRVVLENGSAVGITEPSEQPEVASRSTWTRDEPVGWRRSKLPVFPGSSWSGVGAGLGVITVGVVGVIVFGQALAGLATGGRAVDSGVGEEDSIDVGFTESALGEPVDSGRGSRARTTGEMVDGEPVGKPMGPSTSQQGRSSGPSSRLDLKAANRSNNVSLLPAETSLGDTAEVTAGNQAPGDESNVALPDGSTTPTSVSVPTGESTPAAPTSPADVAAGGTPADDELGDGAAVPAPEPPSEEVPPPPNAEPSDTGPAQGNGKAGEIGKTKDPGKDKDPGKPKDKDTGKTKGNGDKPGDGKGIGKSVGRQR